MIMTDEVTTSPSGTKIKVDGRHPKLTSISKNIIAMHANSTLCFTLHSHSNRNMTLQVEVLQTAQEMQQLIAIIQYYG